MTNITGKRTLAAIAAMHSAEQRKLRLDLFHLTVALLVAAVRPSHRVENLMVYRRVGNGMKRVAVIRPALLAKIGPQLFGIEAFNAFCADALDEALRVLDGGKAEIPAELRDRIMYPPAVIVDDTVDALPEEFQPVTGSKHEVVDFVLAPETETTIKDVQGETTPTFHQPGELQLVPGGEAQPIETVDTPTNPTELDALRTYNYTKTFGSTVVRTKNFPHQGGKIRKVVAIFFNSSNGKPSDVVQIVDGIITRQKSGGTLAMSSTKMDGTGWKSEKLADYIPVIEFLASENAAREEIVKAA